MKRLFTVCIMGVTGGGWLLMVGMAGAEPVSFDRSIRPILSDHCFLCHGPDGSSRKADLRLDLEDNAKGPLRDGSTRALVPGDPEASEVFRRITSADPEEMMPPPQANKPLTPEQIATVGQWISEGAPWARHWAFVPPAAHPVDGDESAHLVDRHVHKALAEQGLSPAPPADRRTLIRRLSLDLTGLPPTRDEIAAFVNDPAPDAYEKQVDRLLASPRYGEHMARYWLDAVRYADTHGFHFDNYREIWPYRDWVIRAFNRNLSFDQFSQWQLAGDLLPNPTDEQRIATGYLRCNPTTNEGGIIDEEYRVEYAVDRVGNFGTVWLGLTVACARCHDHKYDPITQEEFYQLFAFFDNTTEGVRDGNRKDPAPVLKVAQPAQQEQMAEITAFLGELDRRMTEDNPEMDAAQSAWEANLTANAAPPAKVELGPWHRMGPFSTEGIENPHEHNFGPEPDGWTGTVSGGTTGWEPDPSLRDGEVAGVGGDQSAAYFARSLTVDRAVQVPVTAGSDDTIKIWLNGRVILDRDVRRAVKDGDEQLGLRLEPGRNDLLVKVVNVSGASGFVMSTDLEGALGLDEHALVDEPGHQRGTRNGTWAFTDAPTNASRGIQARLQESSELVQHFYIDDPQPPVIEAGHALYAWVYLDPENPPRSIMLQYNNGTWDHRAHWGERDAISFGKTERDLPLYRYMGPLPPTGQWVRLEVDTGAVGLARGDALRGMAFTQYGGRAWWDNAGLLQADPNEAMARLARVPPAKRDEAQRRRLRAAYRREQVPAFATWEADMQASREKLAQLEREIPVTLVAAERSMPRETRFLERGQYDLPGRVVDAGVPDVLPDWPESTPTNRLGLAQWLFEPDHPLTARVAVNRFWQQLFGVGLVKTSEDLGSQGERPLHPELLDDLAVQFVADGWDVKALMKRLVSSQTYQQSARITAEARDQDPENRWLARGPRYRMDAEALRDQALLVGGLLVEREGGPPVRPYQPEGIWKAVAYESSDTANYQRDEGDALYRRSLYTIWKRTAPPATLKVLDAPSREFCVVRRERTNTPLAALALLNDITFVEAARMLAQRTLQEFAGDADAVRIRTMFERVTGRMPTDAETALVAEFLDEQRAVFGQSRDRAVQLLETGESPRDASLDPAEHAAWTLVANLLLNLDETLNKG